MFVHPSHHDGIPTPTRFDDSLAGPDSNEWPGEQLRRLDDNHRSWREDRYRRSADTSAHTRQAGGPLRPRGDGTPALAQPQRRGSHGQG